MPEIKNTFLQSKMNKDLDARLVPNGQYRDAQNININKSEGPDAGAIENIVSNLKVTNFNIIDSSCEVIGSYFDEVNERIYVFITNYNDTSIDVLSNNSAAYASNDVNNNSTTGVNSILAYYDFSTGNTQILLFGSWLNFSKTHPILDINLLENLLFWTDNRNQPRKINVDKAINSPYDLTNTSNYNNPYYVNEDQISVAKYYPYNPITLIATETVTGVTQTVLGSNSYVVGQVYNANGGSGSGLQLQMTSTTGNAVIYDAGVGYTNGDTVTVPVQTSPSAQYTVTVGFEAGMQDVTSPLLPESFTVTIPNASSGPHNAGTSITVSTNTTRLQYWVGATISLNTSIGAPTIPADTRIVSATTTSFVLNNNVTFLSGDVINIGANPNLDVNFQGDEDFLTDKFVKFAYRFKFDDNEYSLISPFTEECYVPKQDGYFLGGAFGDGNDIESTWQSTIVNFMENKIDRIKFRLQAPDKIDQTQMTWAESIDLLKIDSVDIIYTDSDSAGLYVIDTITTEQLLAKNNSIYLYEYNSRKPIRILPESETTRVSDKVPIRAKTQETVGNRVIYGNYVASLGRPEDLNYNVQVDEKYENSNSTSLEIATSPYLRIEYPNHTVKQNRTYQVGVVLVDRYGRQSDTILSSNDAFSGATGFQGSTYFHPYRTANEALSTFNAGSRTNVWAGDSIKVLFNNVIPSSSSVIGYAGLYENNQTNPLGWYSYKIVVKQQEQEYYNVYLPGLINGYPYNSASIPIPPTNKNTAHAVLFSDNINKIPRDLQEVGPEQKQFRASEELFLRLDTDAKRVGVQYYPELSPDTARVIGTYKDLELNLTQDGRDWTQAEESVSPFYTVPGNGFGLTQPTPTNIPFTTNSTSLIARIDTRKISGISGGYNTGSNFVPADGVGFYKNNGLAVYETAPVFSNLDIYYETATSGRISDLNTSILVGDTSTPVSLQPLNFNYDESMGPLSVVSSDFYPLGNGGVVLNNANTTCVISSVLNGNGSTVQYFEVVKNANNSFKIRTKTGVYNWYKNISSNTDNFTFNFTVTNVDSNGVTVTSPITVNPPNLLSNAQPGWVDNGGSLGPPLSGTSPYSNFNTSYAPNAGTLVDPAPSNITQALAGNTWLKLVALNGFNGSIGDGSSGNIPFMIKNELVWVPTKLEFYWTGKPAGADWQEFSPTQSEYNGFGGFSYVGLPSLSNMITISNYTGQAYSDIPETVFHRLRALNHPASVLSGNTGSVAQYVYPAQEGTGANASNPVYGLAQSGIAPTQYRVTLELRDIGGNSGYLNRELKLEFYVTPSTTASGNLQATSSGGGGGGGQQQSQGS